MVLEQIASLEAEQAVLGSVIVEPESLDDIPWLEVDDFYYPANRTLFEYMRYLYENDMPIDLVTMTEELIKYDKLDTIGGPSYFVELSGMTSSASNIRHYAEIVRRKSVRRRGAALGQKMTDLAQDNELSEDEYIAEVEQQTEQLRPKQKNGGLVHIKDTREQFMQHMQQPDDFIKTGIDKFDDWGGGYARKSFVVKAGRPSVGKTAEMLQEAIGISGQGEGAVAIFSQEMHENQVKTRMISNISGLNYTRIRRKWVMQDIYELDRLNKAYDTLQRLPIYIQASKGMTIQEVRADVRKLHRKVGKIAAIYLDYLTLLKINVPKGSRRDLEVGNVCWVAKMMADEFDCPFVMLAQLSRAGDTGEEPKMSHLKESGDIEQHADMIEFLWIDPKDEKPAAVGNKIVTRTIAKGRDTGTGSFKYLFRGAYQRYEDYEPPKDERPKDATSKDGQKYKKW